MYAVTLGLCTAVLWAGATLALRAAAGAIPGDSVSLWFLLETTLLLIPLFLISESRVDLGATTIAVAGLAGFLQGLATLAFRRALATTEVSVVAPLVSLEGAFAALAATIAGGPAGVLMLTGLTVAAVGAITLGLPGRRAAWTPGAGLSILAAAGFGAVLWLVGSERQISVIPLTLALNGFATGALFMVSRGAATMRDQSPRGHAFIALAGAFNVAGFLVYGDGSRSGSVPVTAMLAAQFGVISVVGGYLVHGERLSMRQLMGLAALVVGVSAVALGSVRSPGASDHEPATLHGAARFLGRCAYPYPPGQITKRRHDEDRSAHGCARTHSDAR